MIAFRSYLCPFLTCHAHAVVLRREVFGTNGFSRELLALPLHHRHHPELDGTAGKKAGETPSSDCLVHETLLTSFEHPNKHRGACHAAHTFFAPS